MLAITYYFLKVILCSGILFLYYWVVLSNKRFHQYNRFYLLGLGVFSWLIPLFKIQVFQPIANTPPTMVQLANIIADNNTQFEEIIVQQTFTINWDLLLSVIYTTVLIVFFIHFLIGILKVYQLISKSTLTKWGSIYLILTNVKGTPFSFFNYIFWNEKVDLQTTIGQQMMQHELVHVHEKHSADKLFMQVLIMVGWFNPFFWLAKKELNMIHEFIADEKAISKGDTATLASMLLTAAYPQQQYLLSNPFFFSPIKRRLAMITNTKNIKWSYARRLIVLPLLATVVVLFAFRKKEAINELPLKKVYTVVIDAGHGGTDHGALAADGTTEKELSLLMLQAIKEVSKNDNIKLVFTRETDVYQKITEKADFVNAQKADLFISLHMNATSKETTAESGIEIYVPKETDKKTAKQSALLASAINQSLQNSFASNGVKERSKGIWILKATECPSVIIECGFLTNKKDLKMLKDANQRSKMAKLIMKGIGNYLLAEEVANKPNRKNKINKKHYPDTLLWIRDFGSIESNKNSNKQPVQLIVRKTNGEINLVRRGNDTTIEPFKFTDASLKSYEVELKSRSITTSKKTMNDCLIILDGKKISIEDFNRIAPNDIESIHVIKDQAAINAYGEEGKNGVLLIALKKKSIPISFSIESPLNNSYVAEGFGENLVHPGFNLKNYNDGIVIKSLTDDKVKAVADGTVSFAGNVGGEYLVIVKGAVHFYSYSKLRELNVKQGDVISKGNVLAKASVKNNENTVMLMVTTNKGKFIDPSLVLASK
jgi:N-acetylmuramoyl-L-alanine amidase